MQTISQWNYRQTDSSPVAGELYILWWHQQYPKQTSDWVYRSDLSHDNQTPEKTKQIARK